MEGARPVRDEDLPHCARLLEDAIEATVHMRGGTRLLAGLAGAAAPLAPRTGAAEARPPGSGTLQDAEATPDAGALLEHWTRSPAHRVVVGTLEDAVVGVAGGHRAPHEGDAVGTVDWVYVEPGARGVGVGTAMFDVLLTWLSAQGCRGVDATALPGDRATKQLFESFGLSARLLVLHRRLP